MEKKKYTILRLSLGIIFTPIILIITLFIFNFYICGWYIEKKFGSNYALSADGQKNVVVLYCKDFACNDGYYVIQDNVIAYNYNKRWIILKSDNEKYWIIDKKIPINMTIPILDENIQAGLIGPLDSLEFYNKLDRYDIKLKLKDRG